MRISAFCLAALLATTLWSATARAAKTIYRCEKDGQVTLTDTPYGGESSPVGSAAATRSSQITMSSTSNPTPAGIWQGQIQYQGRENGQTLEEAHSVVPIILEFTADEKISGATNDNGCKWLGVWSQGGRIVSIDVSLTACQYGGLNRRYAGTYLLAVSDSSGEMGLQAYTPRLPSTKIRLYPCKEPFDAPTCRNGHKCRPDEHSR